MLDLLLATALAVRPAQHLPVHRVAQPVMVSREAPQKTGEAGLNLSAYCDASRQSWIMVTNAGPTALVVEWTLTAIKPGHPVDSWSSVSRVESGQFEGWMSPAPYLHLDIRYDEDGLPVTDGIDASCPAAASQFSGIEE